MYCPRCGRQASEEVSFCSGCGLPLEDAAALVAAGGRLAARDGDSHEGSRALTPRQRGERKGLLIIAGGTLFFGLAFLLMLIKEDFFVLMLPAALVITVGVMRMLYAFLLEDDSARRKSPKLAAAAAERRRTTLDRGPRDAAARLPHARTRPASDFTNKTADTADMVAPPSVTESATKLLKDDA